MMLPHGCDTHVHVIGHEATYPMVAERKYTPGPASVKALQAHLAGQGLTRAVIIQPSVYGTDNQCLLDALADMKGCARGIAVLDAQVSDATLKALDAQGMRGIRLNLESAGEHNIDRLQAALQTWAPRLANLGWHIQVYAPMDMIAACATQIKQLPVPVVLDHFALWHDPACTSPASLALLDLLAQGQIYIKLSASYRSPIENAHALHTVSRRLLNTRADRLLWASDWPHTNREPRRHAHEVSAYRDIKAESLEKECQQWLPTAEAQQQVLVDNPHLLYRF